jgi:histidinol-phosphate phosphatase family protein
MKKNAAVFLDRDGTIIEEVGYLDSLEKLILFPHTAEAIRTINESGMRAVVITNQSGVTRGYFKEDFVRTVHRHIEKTLREKGAVIDGFYYCPHKPMEGDGESSASCTCRKPEPGMLIRAAEEMDIDLTRSYVVGDTEKDIILADKVGAKGILVRTGYGSETEKEIIGRKIKPAYIADDILVAVRWIIEDRKR